MSEDDITLQLRVEGKETIAAAKDQYSAFRSEVQKVNQASQKLADAERQLARDTYNQIRSTLALEDAMGGLAASEYSTARAIMANSQATASAAGTVGRYGTAAVAAKGSTRNLGGAFLEASRGLEDMQYGMNGVVNNIPTLVTQMGGTMGMAAAFSVVAVAANQFVKHWDDIQKALGLGFPTTPKETAETLAHSVSKLSKEFGELAEKSRLSFAELQRYKELEKEIREAKAKAEAAKSVEKVLGTKGKIQAEESAGFNKAVVAGGGGEAVLEELIDALRANTDASGKVQSPTLNNTDTPERIAKGLLAELESGSGAARREVTGQIEGQRGKQTEFTASLLFNSPQAVARRERAKKAEEAEKNNEQERAKLQKEIDDTFKDAMHERIESLRAQIRAEQEGTHESQKLKHAQDAMLAEAKAFASRFDDLFKTAIIQDMRRGLNLGQSAKALDEQMAFMITKVLKAKSAITGIPQGMESQVARQMVATQRGAVNVEATNFAMMGGFIPPEQQPRGRRQRRGPLPSIAAPERDMTEAQRDKLQAIHEAAIIDAGDASVRQDAALERAHAFGEKQDAERGALRGQVLGKANERDAETKARQDALFKQFVGERGEVVADAEHLSRRQRGLSHAAQPGPPPDKRDDSTKSQDANTEQIKKLQESIRDLEQQLKEPRSLAI